MRELKCRGTYLSENALLIDSMEARAWTEEAQQARSYHQSFMQIPALSRQGCGNDNCTNVVAWLTHQLQRLDRVEAYQQRFEDPDEPGRMRTNVYGVLRAAPLADGKESIVLVAHYTNVGTAHAHQEYSSVSLGLALLRFLGEARWLAKDVVLLLADDGLWDGTDGHAPGTNAWLRAYHMDPLLHDDIESLPMRAGVIRAALNIETLGDLGSANAVGLFGAGSNGQLPNLDLINTAVEALEEERIPALLDRCDALPVHEVSDWCDDSLAANIQRAHKVASSVLADHDRRHAVNRYLDNLGGMLRFMKQLATGPSGPHASFISYNIDSITLAAVRSRRHGDAAMDLRSFTRVIELVTRAMSNLEEKLHQSFFFYVLPTTRTFVSVGEYYYTVVLAISPAIAHLLYLGSRTIGMNLAFGMSLAIVAEVVGALQLVLISRMISSTTAHWFGFALLMMVTELIVVLVIAPTLRTSPLLAGCAERRAWRLRILEYELKSQRDQASANEDSGATAAVSTTTAVDEIPEQDVGWRAIKFCVMGVLVYTHCILGVLNYPFALSCAVPMALFALIAPAAISSRTKNAFSALWLAMTSPMALVALTFLLSPQDFPQSARFLVQAYARSLNLLALPYLCCVYLPAHILSTAVWLSPPS
ncbi:TPA: hypothetical protein N0F65_012955 [Lagenidium giganteum]|uniref:Transmembrane protein n=1 Tax=Lagenidium giganteum TaxID=4803 RepID=A0AAV2Z4D3_9STRA|nr:TPA: hypothetical protein N0F65_012955 [Lagenidium giganteum]